MDELRVTAARRTGAAVTDLVGDGCVVRLHDRRGDTLEAVAVHHRDPRRRAALRERLEGTSIPHHGWAGEPLRKALSMRLLADPALAAVGCEAAGVHAAVAAPLRVGGEPIGVVVALRDETEHPYTPADQALVERLAAGAHELTPPQRPACPPPGRAAVAARVLEHAAAGVWAIDGEGVTTYVNEPLCTLLGVPSSALEGHSARPFLDDVLAGDGAALTDHRIERPDGTLCWVEVTSAPLTDRAGTLEGTVLTLVDVDARRRSHVDLRLRAAASETLAELSERALAGECFESLAGASVAAVRDVLDADAAAISHVALDRRSFVLSATSGWDPALEGVVMPLPERTPAWYALEEDEPFVVGDYGAGSLVRRGELVAERGLRSVACVSVAGGAGFVAAHSRAVAPFDEIQVGFLRSLARVLTARWEPLRAEVAASAVA